MKSIVLAAIAVIASAGLLASASIAKPGTSLLDLGETSLVLPAGYGGGQSKK